MERTDLAPALPAPPLWQRYVALGDSFTEGLSDLAPDGSYRGWADLIAERLATRGAEQLHQVAFEYANLAVRGRLLGQIVDQQVPAAVRLGPDLVSLVGGGNDVLRPGGDPDALAGQLERAVQQLRLSGAEVLLATPVDPALSPVLRLTRGRFAVYAANIWSIAAQHGAMVLDLWGMRSLRDSQMWAPDRIHLTTDGHRRVAAAAAHVLGLDDAAPDVPLPEATPAARRQNVRQDAAWARQHLGPWVGRRLRGRSSGDQILPKRPTAAPLEPANQPTNPSD